MYDFALAVYGSGAQVWASDCDHNLEAACSGILAGAAKGGPDKFYRARQVKLLLSQPCLKTLALQRYGANVLLRPVAYSSHLPHFLPHWVSSVTRAHGRTALWCLWPIQRLNSVRSGQLGARTLGKTHHVY
jgi:hypothetical protein